MSRARAYEDVVCSGTRGPCTVAGSIGACFQGMFGGVGGVLVDPVMGGGGARGVLCLWWRSGLPSFGGTGRWSVVSSLVFVCCVVLKALLCVVVCVFHGCRVFPAWCVQMVFLSRRVFTVYVLVIQVVWQCAIIHHGA